MPHYNPRPQYEPRSGLKPGTFGLADECSTTELTKYKKKYIYIYIKIYIHNIKPVNYTVIHTVIHTVTFLIYKPMLWNFTPILKKAVKQPKLVDYRY